MGVKNRKGVEASSEIRRGSGFLILWQRTEEKKTMLWGGGG